MGIIRTFISHSNDDKRRVHDILRRVAPYGARPWIDDQDLQGQAGRSLHELIPSAIADPSCRSLSLFLSAASVKSQWVLDEVGVALALIPDGWRIIPVALDPVTDLALPAILETALRKRGNRFDTIYLDPTRPAFVEDYAAAVLHAGGATEAEDVVLYLGNRNPHWQPNLSAPWRELPAVDLRLQYPVGNADFSPTDAEWAEIRHGIAFLQRCLRRVQTLHVTGRAPLGVAVIAGRTWDRGTGTVIEGWNGNERGGEIWTGVGAMATDDWTPSSGKWLPGRIEGSPFAGATKLTVAFLRREDQEPATRAWNASRSPEPPLLLVRCPARISTANEATAVLNEALGVFSWVRRTCHQVKEIDLVLAMPLAHDALLAHHLRQLGTIHFYDQVSPPTDPAYRLAISWL
ncbi:MAG: TIR domain-containing protein [Deltaproteobacteria bacterium]|nr:MAG: TIR domain-containing protein [Deltaproteobacteria bacterium]